MGIYTGKAGKEWLRQQAINIRVGKEWDTHRMHKPVYDDDPNWMGMKASFNAQSRKRIDEEEVDDLVRAANLA